MTRTRPRWLAQLLRGWPTLVGWAGGAVLTLWILWGPMLPFGVHSPRAQVVMHTIDLCIALLAGYLASLRYARARRLGDLLLAQSLFGLALATAAGLVLQGRGGNAELWLPVTLRVAATLVLLGAALVASDRTVPRGGTRWASTVTALLLLVAAGTAWNLGSVLPVGMVRSTGEDIDRVHPELLAAHPLLTTAYVTSAVCLLLASHLFTVRALATGDELLRWLGPACALGGFARVAYAVTPTNFSDWFYTGDLLRTGFYLLLVIGAARELSQHWTARTAQAVADDRRRLARELHDGVVQELSYIRVEAHRIAEDEGVRRRIVGATDRALDEARTAIQALGSMETEPLAVLLRRAAAEQARRHRVQVEVDADEEVTVDADQTHALLRITREAVSNAARHGRAGIVRVVLRSGDGGRLLSVRDDGVGFDPDEAARTRSGYGLVSMDERARSLPGTLRVHSTPGSGSEVQVRW